MAGTDADPGLDRALASILRITAVVAGERTKSMKTRAKPAAGSRVTRFKGRAIG